MTDTDKNAEPEIEETTEIRSDPSSQGDQNRTLAGTPVYRKLMIAGAGVAGVAVAFLLFIAPGDRVLGFETDRHSMERAHGDEHDESDRDDRDDDYERGSFEDMNDPLGYGPRGYGVPGPGVPPPGAPSAGARPGNGGYSPGGSASGGTEAP
jgi:hypothetical protein